MCLSVPRAMAMAMALVNRILIVGMATLGTRGGFPSNNTSHEGCRLPLPCDCAVALASGTPDPCLDGLPYVRDHLGTRGGLGQRCVTAEVKTSDSGGPTRACGLAGYRTYLGFTFDE